jgi:hypothetical protein
LLTGDTEAETNRVIGVTESILIRTSTSRFSSVVSGIDVDEEPLSKTPPENENVLSSKVTSQLAITFLESPHNKQYPLTPEP